MENKNPFRWVTIPNSARTSDCVWLWALKPTADMDVYVHCCVNTCPIHVCVVLFCFIHWFQYPQPATTCEQLALKVQQIGNPSHTYWIQCVRWEHESRPRHKRVTLGLKVKGNDFKVISLLLCAIASWEHAGRDAIITAGCRCRVTAAHVYLRECCTRPQIEFEGRLGWCVYVRNGDIIIKKSRLTYRSNDDEFPPSFCVCLSIFNWRTILLKWKI